MSTEQKTSYLQIIKATSLFGDKMFLIYLSLSEIKATQILY